MGLKKYLLEVWSCVCVHVCACVCVRMRACVCLCVCVCIYIYICLFVVCSSPVKGLDWPRGFQEVKVPRFHDNGTERW